MPPEDLHLDLQDVVEARRQIRIHQHGLQPEVVHRPGGQEPGGQQVARAKGVLKPPGREPPAVGDADELGLPGGGRLHAEQARPAPSAQASSISCSAGVSPGSLSTSSRASGIRHSFGKTKAIQSSARASTSGSTSWNRSRGKSGPAPTPRHLPPHSPAGTLRASPDRAPGGPSAPPPGTGPAPGVHRAAYSPSAYTP